MEEFKYTDGTPHEWIMDAKKKPELLELSKEELVEEIFRLRQSVKQIYLSWRGLHTNCKKLSEINDMVDRVVDGFLET